MTDWEGILDRDGPAVWRTVWRLLGRRADADECFQETFLAALVASRREPIANPRALLLRLATRRAMDRLRDRYRRRAEPGEIDWAGLPSPHPPPGERAEAAELSAALREALALLPARQAEAFSHCCLDDRSYAEAAALLEISTDAVGVLVHRARARLRELLAPRAGVDR